MSDPTPHPTTDVARDLTAITTLAPQLLTQAVHQAGDRIGPGGEAMVALGPGADLAAWEDHVYDAERHHLETCDRPHHRDCHYAEFVTDADDQHHENPLTTLLFWSEAWRAERGYPLDGRTPTLVTEAAFIRHSLDWAWDHEPHWADFARDMAQARRRVEDMLHAGERSQRGAPCLYESCGGVRLVRKLIPARAEGGAKTWVLSDWHCPRCKRSWDEDAYARMVTAAHVAAQREEIAGQTWVSLEHAAREVGRPRTTVRAWVDRGLVAVACVITGRRSRFVPLDDVRELDEQAARRNTAA